MVRTEEADLAGTVGVQSALLGDLMRNVDRFLLIILDACRWDALQELRSFDVQPALSSAINTGTWIRGNWPGQYDITYVAANPHLAEDTDRPGMADYRGQDHFSKIVHTWDHGWDEDLGTVPPKAVADDVLDNRDSDRIIAHFMQPHTPYIGDERPDKDINAWFQMRGDPDLESLDREDVRTWYMHNLIRVLEEGVQPLIGTVNRPIIVTSDHGEALGEGGVYGHGSVMMEVLLVPYVAYAVKEDLDL